MTRPARDNLHSRLVAVLKVVLPLLALAILSTLFLFSRGIRPEDAIPYADVDIADRLREPRMTDAGFAGVTSDGAALTLTASEAQPASGAEPAAARGVVAALETPDGAKTELAAAQVQVDGTAKMVELSGGVELRSSAGYLLEAQGFGVSTEKSLVESRGPVSGSTPMGQLTADQMRLTGDTAGAASYLLVFKGRVRLLYQPQK